MKLRLSLVVLLLLLVVALPSPAVSETACIGTYVVSPNTYWYASSVSGCTNLQGYRVIYTVANGGTVFIHLDNIPLNGVYTYIEPLPLNTFYNFPSAGDYAIRNTSTTDNLTFTISAVPPPTATPTLTSTATPTVVIVTVTPSPSPTPNPSIALQERADQTFSLQIFGFSVMIGLGVWAFLRRR